MHRKGHIFLLHHSEGERLRWLAEWCELGLRNGEKVVYVDVAGWGADALTSALVGRGLDLSSALERGQFEFVGLKAALGLGADGDDVVTAALDAGYHAVRLTVRQDALAEIVGPVEAQLVEQRVAACCHEAPMSVLCQYDGRTTTGDDMWRAMAQHPDWLFEADLSVQHRGHVIRIEGVLDGFDEDILVRALKRMSRWLGAEQPMALDMRGVKALSLGAVLAVLGGTKAFRQRGGMVEIGTPAGDGGDLIRSLVTRADQAGIELK